LIKYSLVRWCIWISETNIVKNIGGMLISTATKKHIFAHHIRPVLRLALTPHTPTPAAVAGVVAAAAAAASHCVLCNGT
jgi:hypothetical protein